MNSFPLLWKLLAVKVLVSHLRYKQLWPVRPVQRDYSTVYNILAYKKKIATLLYCKTLCKDLSCLYCVLTYNLQEGLTSLRL